MTKIGAIIVTYNRKELLDKSIKALLSQNIEVNKIIIINNASTDGTEKLLTKYEKEYPGKFTIVNLLENLGGAGGFSEGIKKAYNEDIEYMWIMDDDTIPKENALEELLRVYKNSEEKIGFVCSNVLFTDNTACIMNIPGPAKKWNSKLAEGLVELTSASFVSLMVHRDIVKAVGLPIKEFFIWGDDVEYTLRISEKYKSFMAFNSIVSHEMKENKGVSISEDSRERIDRYFYAFRNKYYIARKYKKLSSYYAFVGINIIRVFTRSKDFKLKRLKTITKGFFRGLGFNPSVEKI